MSLIHEMANPLIQRQLSASLLVDITPHLEDKSKNNSNNNNDNDENNKNNNSNNNDAKKHSSKLFSATWLLHREQFPTRMLMPPARVKLYTNHVQQLECFSCATSLPHCAKAQLRYQFYRVEIVFISHFVSQTETVNQWRWEETGISSDKTNDELWAPGNATY